LASVCGAFLHLSKKLTLTLPLLSFRTLPLLLLISWLLVGCAGQSRLSPGGTDGYSKTLLSGELRVLVWPQPTGGASVPDPLAQERELAQDFAYSLGLQPVFIEVKSYLDMISQLADGQGDMIAARPPTVAALKKSGGFQTANFRVSEFWLVTAKSYRLPRKLKGLAGLSLCLRSPGFTAAALKQTPGLPKFKKVTWPYSMGTADILDRLKAGECQGALVERTYWKDHHKLHPKLKLGPQILGPRPVPFVMRPSSKRLHRKANLFLFGKALGRRAQRVSTDDWDQIKKSGVLRMLTRPNNLNFFVAKGEQQGFEYALVRKFAQKHKLRLEVVVPSYHSELLSWLNAGKGDLVAASMTVTPERKKQAKFTYPYNHTEELVVVHKNNRKIRRLKDLAGKTIHLRKSSSFYQTLLSKKIKGLQFEFLPEDMETEDILLELDQGRIQITVADSNLVRTEQASGRKIKKAFRLARTKQAWAVRQGNHKLKAKLDKFIKVGSRSGLIKIQREQSIESRKARKASHGAYRADTHGRISPYDEIVQEVADQYNFDWKLITSQMYQESRFDPTKKSHAGAMGLLQVMPRTAKEMGLKHRSEIADPRVSIELGVKYMAKMFKRLKDVPRLKDRVYFALASYNAGFSHVQDARILAKRLKLDPDRWFGNVEKTLRLLEQPKYYKKARYGYCRGWEPIQYVTKIQNRYSVYVEHVPNPGY